MQVRGSSIARGRSYSQHQPQQNVQSTQLNTGLVLTGTRASSVREPVRLVMREGSRIAPGNAVMASGPPYRTGSSVLRPAAPVPKVSEQRGTSGLRRRNSASSAASAALREMGKRVGIAVPTSSGSVGAVEKQGVSPASNGSVTSGWDVSESIDHAVMLGNQKTLTPDNFAHGKEEEGEQMISLAPLTLSPKPVELQSSSAGYGRGSAQSALDLNTASLTPVKGSRGEKPGKTALNLRHGERMRDAGARLVQSTAGKVCTFSPVAVDSAGDADAEGEVEALMAADSPSSTKDGPRRRSVGKGRAHRTSKTTINVTQHCRDISCELVRLTACSALGWREVSAQDCNFWWLDSGQGTVVDRYSNLVGKQKVNYVVGMHKVCRKKGLFRLLNHMRGEYPKLYDWAPPTWVLPEDYDAFVEEMSQKKPKTFIVKPDGGCQGAGIYLLRTGMSIPFGRTDKYIAQRYIHKPLLLDGYKFDLRVYVLVTSVDPLRAYIFDDGLARLCTEKYSVPSSKNVKAGFKNLCMHLSNYSLNKFNSNFDHTEDLDQGSKRSMKLLLESLSEQGVDTDLLWDNIKNSVMKCLVAMHPTLWFQYHNKVHNLEGHSCCYQVLGFDFLVDWRLRTWLLEVFAIFQSLNELTRWQINNHPSMNLDEPIDRAIKIPMMEKTFGMVKPFFRKTGPRSSSPTTSVSGVSPAWTEEDVFVMRRRRMNKAEKALEWEAEHCGGWCAVIPSPEYSVMEEDVPFMSLRLQEAYEVGARVGDRDRHGMRGLKGPAFVRVMRSLGALDGGRLARHDLDLVFIETTKHLPVRDREMDYALFYTAVITASRRKFPEAKSNPQAVQMLLAAAPPSAGGDWSDSDSDSKPGKKSAQKRRPRRPE